jgi:nitrogen fixation-related uncharacterized protein
MNQAKKLLFYVVLNIVVSAVTIIGVLYLWENTKLKNMLFDSSDITAEDSLTDQVSDEAAASDNLLIEIGEVGGIGNLATEYVRLVRPGSEPGDTISLQDWSIKDENNHQYNILEQSGVASLDLHGQGAVNIYTKEGDSNPIELYLGLTDPIWQPGETVTLIGPGGEVHDTYLIP